ncbi:MAG: WG repeat-containing protein [Synergistaceae bacterium]|nr:WG repeat-containing protein [Synergistaceae bacterium]
MRRGGVMSLVSGLLLGCVAALFPAGRGAEAREARVVVDFQYAEAREFSEGLAAVRSGDLWGYIGVTGRVAVPFRFKTPEAGRFSEGVAFVGGHFIDTKGNPAFGSGDETKTFERASSFSEGLAAVQSNGRWGYIGPGGLFTIPPTYEDAGDFSGGMAPVRKNGLWGYIDAQGRMLINPRFLKAWSFGDIEAVPSGNNRRLAAVNFEGRIGYIDRSGRFVIRPVYDEGGTFRNGLAPVRGSGARNDWGYVDASGREMVPRRFHGAGTFEGGLAPVATDARWGYIDVKGRMVLNAFYDSARPFSEGLAAVEQDGKWGYIQVK